MVGKYVPCGDDLEVLRVVRTARLIADAAVREAPGGAPSLSGNDAAVLLRFLRKLAGLDGLGEREEPILEALLAIAEDA